MIFNSENGLKILFLGHICRLYRFSFFHMFLLGRVADKICVLLMTKK